MDAAYEWLALDDEETVVWAETPHPYSLVPAVVVGVVLSVVLVGVVVLVSAYLTHRNTNYVVTTEALYKKTGVFSRNVQRIEFDKVQDTSYRQRFLGTRFGFGTVDVSTAGSAGIEMSFANVADPRHVQTLINERAGTGRHVDAPADDEVDAVLADILDELRAIRSAMEADDGREDRPLAEVETDDTRDGNGTEDDDGTGDADDAGDDDGTGDGDDAGAADIGDAAPVDAPTTADESATRSRDPVVDGGADDEADPSGDRQDERGSTPFEFRDDR